VNARRRRTLLLALIAVQVIVLVGMPLRHGARIAAGTEVRLRVEPVDPTDLARGSYVDLRYVGFDELEVPDGAGSGDDVYVELRNAGERGVFEPSGTVVTDTDAFEDDDTWIRLPVGCCDEDEGASLEGISTWYASPDKARAAERDLADGDALAVVSLDEDGSPTLVDVVEG
jgi:hypothetical protein